MVGMPALGERGEDRDRAAGADDHGRDAGRALQRALRRDQRGGRGVEARRLGAVQAQLELGALGERVAQQRAPARARSPRCAGRPRAARTGSPRRARARSCAARRRTRGARRPRCRPSCARAAPRPRGRPRGGRPASASSRSPGGSCAHASSSACDGASRPGAQRLRRAAGLRVGEHGGEQPVQDVDGVERGAAELARVGGALARGDGEVGPHHPARADGQRRRVGVEHARSRRRSRRRRRARRRPSSARRCRRASPPRPRRARAR